MTIVGLLVAAGRGERLGAGQPKAFVECAGRALLEWSLEVLIAACDSVVVAAPPELVDPPARPPAGASGGRGSAGPAPSWVAGAESRSGSVRAALAAAPQASVAVVHDAARPLVTPELVERCVRALGEGWDGAVAAAPLADTVKEAAPDDRRVVRTLRREGLWAVQTPQVFRGDALREALAVTDEDLAAASDDASLVEAAGGAVRVVSAPAENLKVTSTFDLRVAEALLRERAARGGGPAAGAAPENAPSAHRCAAATA